MAGSWPSLPYDALPFSGGVYLLAAELKRGYQLRVGGLGRHLFPRGSYLYVGSAQRNLIQRLRRHVSGHSVSKKFHWHIDYLLAHARIRFIRVFAAPKEWECRLGRRLAGLKDSKVVLKGFGSSDCRCKTHLYYFPAIPKARVPKKSPNTVCHSERDDETLRYAQGNRRNTICHSERSEESSVLEICARDASAFGVTSVVSLPQNDNYAGLFRSLETVVEDISLGGFRGLY
ncbi:MAG: DUF123 domain-containing protein [Candidatus Brocadiales bacterium]